MNNLPQSSPVSGADWFMMAMDPHMTRYKAVGNVCRYALFINGRIDEKMVRLRLQEKGVFQWLSRLTIRRKIPFQIPKWEPELNHSSVQLNVHESPGDEIPEHLFSRDIRFNSGSLFHIDIINIPGNKSIFIFSWHHILMDGRGAGMLLKYLNGDVDVSDPSCLAPMELRSRTFRQNWNNMMITKDFLKESSRKPLATLFKSQPKDAPVAHYRVLKFSEKETSLIHEHAHKHGARFGKSPFYLACSIRAANKILIKRGDSGSPFWIPVPQDERLRGAFGPVISNQLSFVFYRIPVEVLGTIKDAVNHINTQLVDQIRSNIP